MEKKLTVEELLKALREDVEVYKQDFRMFGDYFDINLLEQAIALIEQLTTPRKYILANKVYTDATLKKWKKEDLIEQIRILEHNWRCAEESLNNSVKNSDKIFAKQQAEIERLTGELAEEKKLYFDMQDVAGSRYMENCQLIKQRNELQKQVEALQKELYQRCDYCKERFYKEAKELFTNSSQKKQLVFICSPYRGETPDELQRNTRNAEWYCRLAYTLGYIPFAPHLYFTRFLADNCETERKDGMAMGKVIMLQCAELWVFGDKISDGMRSEIACAEAHSIPVKYLTNGGQTK